MSSTKFGPNNRDLGIYSLFLDYIAEFLLVLRLFSVSPPQSREEKASEAQRFCREEVMAALEENLLTHTAETLSDPQ